MCGKLLEKRELKSIHVASTEKCENIEQILLGFPFLIMTFFCWLLYELQGVGVVRILTFNITLKNHNVGVVGLSPSNRLVVCTCRLNVAFAAEADLQGYISSE